jgi:hypothetical protein
MTKPGRHARHDPTHAISHLGSVDSLPDVVSEALPKRPPHLLIDGQWCAHGVRFRSKVGSDESGLDQRDADAKGSQLQPQYIGVGFERVLGG